MVVAVRQRVHLEEVVGLLVGAVHPQMLPVEGVELQLGLLEVVLYHVMTVLLSCQRHDHEILWVVPRFEGEELPVPYRGLLLQSSLFASSSF